jgi:ATPase subunit of ABC transporter with duplicated ATPase domains
MVCHDTDVLDRVCNETWYLRSGKIERIGHAYSEARALLFQLDEARKDRRKAQEKEVERVKESAKVLNTWAKNSGNEKFARRAKSMQKRAERMENELQDVVIERHGSVKVPGNSMSADYLVCIKEREYETPCGRPLFRAPDIFIKPGDRLVIMGRNGVGKSTFVRTLVDSFRKQNDRCQFNPRLSLGYFDQKLDEVKEEWSLFRFVREASIEMNDQSLRKLLVDAGFAFEDHNKEIRFLSGGEKARLMLLAFSISNPNFLVLDEPTNHIDVYGVERVAQDLSKNHVSAVIVTHSRSFARAVGTRFLEISEDGVKEPTQTSLL